MKHIDTPAAQRLRETISYAKKRAAPFAKWIGVSQPGISNILTGRNKSISNEIAEKITIAMPQINPEWLMWGRGEMLRSKNNNEKVVGESVPDAAPASAGEPLGRWEALEREVEALKKEVEALKEEIKEIKGGK